MLGTDVRNKTQAQILSLLPSKDGKEINFEVLKNPVNEDFLNEVGPGTFQFSIISISLLSMHLT